LIGDIKLRSRERAESAGLSRKAVPRYVAGVEILIDRLCEPTTRRILLMDGPVVLGRDRWYEVWGEPMRDLGRGVFRDAALRGDVATELVEPLGQMLYGALQEAALAIGDAADPDAARRVFGAAAEWVISGLLQPRFSSKELAG